MSDTTSEQAAPSPVRADALRVGDLVRVKSREEILATLDHEGRVDGLPFMPEMLAYAGRTLPVDAVVNRTCDTVKASGSSGTTRGMERATHLQGARCDGSAHGGCQARCLLFWKEEWLESVPYGETPDESQAAMASAPVGDVPTFLETATRAEDYSEAKPVYSCQATELLRATQFVSARDPRVWLKDIQARNATMRDTVASIAVIVFNKWQAFSTRLPRWLRIHGGQSWPWLTPTGEGRSFPRLDLQPGELVEVRSQDEIESTLDEKGELRGLRFSAEMVPYCGRQARVVERVDRIVDEKSGRLLKLRDCILLEDMWCEGTFRALCRRKIYTFWREAWLRRIDDQISDSTSIQEPPEAST